MEALIRLGTYACNVREWERSCLRRIVTAELGLRYSLRQRGVSLFRPSSNIHFPSFIHSLTIDPGAAAAAVGALLVPYFPRGKEGSASFSHFMLPPPSLCPSHLVRH